jgi:hypothetical protein
MNGEAQTGGVPRAGDVEVGERPLRGAASEGDLREHRPVYTPGHLRRQEERAMRNRLLGCNVLALSLVTFPALGGGEPPALGT